MAGRRPGVAAFAPLLLCACGVARAQMQGDDVVVAGWIHLHPIEQSGKVDTHIRSSAASTVLGVPEDFDSPDTSLAADDNDTLGLSYAHFFTDHWAVEIDAGLPPKVQVKGRGVVQPPGASGLLFNLDLGDPAVNPLGSARQWSPAAALQYRFGETTWWARPFLGAGVSYTWFTQVHASDAFAAQVDRRMGSVLAVAAGRPGPTTLHTRIDPVVSPVLNGGLAVAVTQRLGMTLAFAFVPVSTDATIDIVAHDGTRLARAKSHADVDALVSGLLATWRF